MTIPEYVTLSLNDRAEVLWEQGSYLETMVYYGYTVKLYSLSAFFVEVYYSPITQSIEKIEVAYQEDLKKYLSKVDFQGLI